MWQMAGELHNNDFKGHLVTDIIVLQCKPGKDFDPRSRSKVVSIVTKEYTIVFKL